ncbi:PREDICTED: uncharacterized protein LOC103340339 [Prunus mume]|uniref:Uncharacterized protein LOC103340339 n=1 Tax=Prunus mume TaxID=102107 RepID=A0ABM0PN25_PRUMU|nr:PREDICTED: uncharacterized protein LOC103340339 [Prunus mume]
MNRILEYSEIKSKPSDDRVGSTQIDQNQIRLGRYGGLKRIRENYIEIESKPSDDRVGSTQIEQNQIRLDRYRGLKRIREEYYQMQSNPSHDFKCGLLDLNPYEWQFGIRGARGTEFEGGIYHGRIQFPEEYPLKPPSFTLLTENGRFKTQNKIRIRRLNDWQPSWRVRDGLLALIAEMPTYPDGDDELDSVKYSKEERRALAIKSREAAPKYGTSQRQKLIDEIHEYMLSKALPFPQLQLSSPSQASKEHEHKHYRIYGNKMKHGSGSRNVGIFDFGNRYTAIDSKSVGILHSMNEAPKLPVPVPQLQLTRNTPIQEEVVVDRVGSTQMELDRSVIVEDKCNIKNSGEKRILEEYNEIESNPSYDFKCLMLDWNPYEWQFALRGPSGTEFEGGIYHGLVQFSEGYPSKPPSIKFLTKNGRLKIQTDISSRLLSNWQSPRSVRNALLALIEEMPTYPDGDDELDSVEYIREERRALAIKSREAAPKCDSPKRQKLIDEIHEYMLSKAPPVPQLQLSSPSQASKEHEHEHYQNYGAKRKHGGGYTNVGISNFGNTLDAIDSRSVGLHSMNEALKPMIKERVPFRVFYFLSVLIGLSSILFGFWSF